MGVSAYNINFFTHYSKNKTETVNLEPGWETLEPLILEPSHAAEFSAGLEPAISLEELQARSRQAYTPGGFPPAGDSGEWPGRDPFRTAEEKGRIASLGRGSAPPGGVRGFGEPSPLPEPELEFSGTFIQDNKKLALIDGVARPVGAWLGRWQLAAIGRDYIILEGGGKTRRVELNRESPDTFQMKSDL